MFILQENPINPPAYANPQNGALASFEGIVRGDAQGNARVNALLYIADTPACKTEGEEIIKEAYSLFSITHAVCIQRIGKVNAGETAVWIGVWAGHRDDAFKGCRYVIEEIKQRLLIWKKEFFIDGTSKWVYGPQTPVIL
ncbi:MAG: molybdenum cofactor biosynthesis protein MoaE [Candidatus Omnitrophica bacterium]|nr:molybdenum cofactor biosynthesis protein MoaE [Candidatus Omnitrophota bacterium]